MKQSQNIKIYAQENAILFEIKFTNCQQMHTAACKIKLIPACCKTENLIIYNAKTCRNAEKSAAEPEAAAAIRKNDSGIRKVNKRT